jgi:hypothetical protein
MCRKLETDLKDFYDSQLKDWPLAGDNYAGLRDVTLRDFNINGHTCHAQFNPKRIISSSAKVDPKSISERPCFLCQHNRPAEQKSISYGKYEILVNPYPVFHHHFTIPAKDHVPQRITGNFRAMLDLARDMRGYTLIYNGPNCGASAPDHFHFQAIPVGILPVERYFEASDFISHPLTMTGKDPDSIEKAFEKLFSVLEKLLPATDEPMINILSLYNAGSWTIRIFPRKAHRPSQYYDTGENQLLISPASIDMGGILVMPREEDFRKINTDTIKEIFNQVCVDKSIIHVLNSQINPL